VTKAIKTLVISAYAIAFVSLILRVFSGLEDAKNFETSDGGEENLLAIKFYSFINLMSCKTRYYTEEQDH